jgi:hypothetical protein
MRNVRIGQQESIRWHCWGPATAAIIVEKNTRKLSVWYPSKSSSNKGGIQPSRPCCDHQGRCGHRWGNLVVKNEMIQSLVLQSSRLKRGSTKTATPEADTKTQQERGRHDVAPLSMMEPVCCLSDTKTGTVARFVWAPT